MQIVLSAEYLPARLRLAERISDAELMAFCAANETLRVEREPNGEILVMTPSGSRTSVLNARLARMLGEWAEEDGSGIAFDSNGGFTLPDGSVRAADAAWVRLDRWIALTDDQQAGFAPICPDFVIELRSPSDRLPEIAAKMHMWMENGAREGWMIDPAARSVTIYRAGEPFAEFVDPTSVQGSGPIRGFELVLARLWG